MRHSGTPRFPCIGKALRRIRTTFLRRGCGSIYEEVRQGAVIGFFVCIAYALGFGWASLSVPLFTFILSLGVLAGAVIGVILWIGSAELPEDAVLSPDPRQERFKAGRRR